MGIRHLVILKEDTVIYQECRLDLQEKLDTELLTQFIQGMIQFATSEASQHLRSMKMKEINIFLERKEEFNLVFILALDKEDSKKEAEPIFKSLNECLSNCNLDFDNIKSSDDFKGFLDDLINKVTQKKKKGKFGIFR